jgi:hypothetical protein
MKRETLVVLVGCIEIGVSLWFLLDFLTEYRKGGVLTAEGKLMLAAELEILGFCLVMSIAVTIFMVWNFFFRRMSKHE